MKYFFSNWKNYLSVEESLKMAENIAGLSKDNVRQVLFPSHLSVLSVKDMLSKSEIGLGCKGFFEEKKGPYTGQVVLSDLVEYGCRYALVGHSEVRKYNQDNDETVSKKLSLAFDMGVVPVLCVGESYSVREGGDAVDFVVSQTEKALKNINSGRVFVAYEPVWAIQPTSFDVGKDDIEDIVVEMYKFLSGKKDLEFDILYGGSVNSNNVDMIMSVEYINGVLVGSASTKYSEYASILEGVSKYL